MNFVRRTLLRIGLGGMLAAAVVLAGGTVLRRAVLGADDRQAFAAIEAEVREVMAGMTLDLRELAQLPGVSPDLIRQAAADAAAAERLFAAVDGAVSGYEPLDAALTVYAVDGRPLAWSGRPTELPRERLQADETWFIAPGALGLRLVYVTMVAVDSERVGAIAAERPLSALAPGALRSREPQCAVLDVSCLPTRLGPVAIQLRWETTRTAGSDSFEVNAPSGEGLFTATVRPEDLALTRGRWTRAVNDLALLVAAIMLLLMTGPLLDWRSRARRPQVYLTATGLAALLLVAARAVLRAASPADWNGAISPAGTTSLSPLLPGLLASPVDYTLTWLTALALVVLAFYTLESGRLRAGRRGARVSVTGRIPLFLAAQLAAGGALAAVLLSYTRILSDTITGTTLDLVHFSLQPWDTGRAVLQAGLVVAHATVAVGGVLLLRAAMLGWRIPKRDLRVRVTMLACWLLPLALWQTRLVEVAWQQLPLLVAAAVIAVAAFQATALRARFRHGSQAFRLTLLTLGLIAPAFAFYPAIFQLAGQAKVVLVETRYAPEALMQRSTLVAELRQSLEAIDRMPDLADRVSGSAARVGGDTPTDNAFEVWQSTPLALYPITSSVELRDPGGSLVSRFAFNLPEDLRAPPRSDEDSCTWYVYGGVAPFFAEERHVLRAGRQLCSPGNSRASQGSVVVHVMLDYENLPFIASRAPYRDLLRPAETLRAADTASGGPGAARQSWTGQDVEFAFYGWSGRPLYPSSQPAWELDDEVLGRLGATRDPFWHQLQRRDDRYDVYLHGDRGGIHALGFPVVTPLGHLVNLAELTVLAVGTYLLLLLLNAAFGWVSRRKTTAPALLREIRASFYRKLFLAFVAAVLLPVAALAVVTRNYVVSEMRATVEQEAVRTASAARRVVEDFVTQLEIGLDDNLMVWVSRLIDQDVNVFDGSRLVATSERNLFASGSLPTRAPADVYWALQLRNEAAIVTHERIGALEEYLVAATPLTGPQSGAMLTVPLTSRQQDIENRIATLNRHMLLGALLFILAGAGLGYSMAERISDPVNRLSRATRRISRGDFDARIVARSSDELRRLVEDFNSMASELRRQRTELERTHRVRAWADMARQVAHEIKNPLTPIQLTAEHLRRVHADRGAPLGPVVEECVGTILTQVRLLRQIASEFSSFASSPTARPTLVAVPELLQDVLEPYRVGLEARIRFDVDVPALPPVHADRTLVARALTNIIENALHAMPGVGTLTVVGRTDSGVVRIRVSDSGAGMDAEAIARAFEPYFSTKSTGTGLGLTIAKRNVELNGGTIAVSSSRDRGTTVDITFPVREGA
jgi:signal transduction histidine kinase